MRILGFGSSSPRRKLGILAFEIAGTMSRLLSLQFSLSNGEIARLCSCMQSEGVAYLNSDQPSVLLRLACAEMVDDLDTAAADVARVSSRCRAAWPHRFQRVYADLKAQTADISSHRLGFQASDLEKKVKKMERYVASTMELYIAMKDLAELEAGEKRRAEKWNKWVGLEKVDPNSGAIRALINVQLNRVNHLRELSLWSRDLTKVCDLMARLVISLLARISAVFGATVVELPPEKSKEKILFRNSSHIFYAAAEESWKRKALEPPRNSLGAASFALRYARVVVFLEQLAMAPERVGKKVRGELYWMLPHGIKSAVRKKLERYWRLDQGWDMASGWKDAVEGILRWLAPMARDTERWHAERSFEKRGLGAAPRVMMLQTLIFADREKSEAAIVELLVAFSFICRYKPREEED